MLKKSQRFSGLTNENPTAILVPEQLFHFLLSDSCEEDVIKISLFFLMKAMHIEGPFIYLEPEDFFHDPILVNSFSQPGESPRQLIETSLKKMVELNIFLEGILTSENEIRRYYFLNSPKGRAAIKAIQSGKWNQKADKHGKGDISEGEVNIFKVYEENIGLITPLIADALKDAEISYPETWIYDAVRIAAEKNKRNWSYILAILKRWQAEGKDGRNDRKDGEKDRKRYTDGEYSEFIDH